VKRLSGRVTRGRVRSPVLDGRAWIVVWLLVLLVAADVMLAAPAAYAQTDEPTVELGEELYPPTDYPTDAGRGIVPIGRYDIGCANDGFVGDVGCITVGTATNLVFSVGKLLVAVAIWLLEAATGFVVEAALTDAATAVADLLDARVLGAMRLSHLGLVVSALYMGWQFLRGRVGLGAGEFALTLVVFAVLVHVSVGPGFGGAVTAAMGTAGGISTEIVSLAADTDRSGDVADRVGGALIAGFVRDPYDTINWGQPLDGTPCAAARSQALASGPHPAALRRPAPRHRPQRQGRRRRGRLPHRRPLAPPPRGRHHPHRPPRLDPRPPQPHPRRTSRHRRPRHAAQDPDGIPTDPVDELVASGAVTDRDLAPTLALDDADPSPSIPTGPVEVRVLGPVHVAGIDRRFPARKCVELVTYLTFHRHGVEADVLMEALWPDQAPNSRRLSQLVSRARLTLGDDPDGIPYVPYVTDGLYRISSHLQTDLDAFIQRIRVAEATSGDEQLDHLHAALDLVQAAPFSGVGSSYAWAHTEGIVTHAIVAIDNTAHQLANLALDAGRLDLAEWAARRGLLATYACEACYRNLMRVAIAQQNPVALEAVYAELLTAVDADDGPDAATWLEPETVELYERHSRRHRRAG